MSKLKILVLLVVLFFGVFLSPAIADDSKKNIIDLSINTEEFSVSLGRILYSHLEVDVAWFADREVLAQQGEAITDGAAARFWLTDQFFSDHLKLGVGVGPYYNNKSTEDGVPRGVSSIMSVLVRYRVKDSLPWSLVARGDRIDYKDHSAKNVWRIGVNYEF
jgi:hypothetical protein